MTPADKAKEIVSKMYQSPFVKKADSIRCATIAVDEIIDCVADLHAIADSRGIAISMTYWQEVKNEIEKI